MFEIGWFLTYYCVESERVEKYFHYVPQGEKSLLELFYWKSECSKSVNCGLFDKKPRWHLWHAILLVTKAWAVFFLHALNGLS